MQPPAACRIGAWSLLTLAAICSSGSAAPESVPSDASFSYANMDPDDDLVVAPPAAREDCAQALTALGVTFKSASIPLHKQGKILCGADQLVSYSKGPGKISYNGTPVLTCVMAMALARFEVVAQEEAMRSFGKRIRSVKHMGTYSCREIAAYPGWVSEHSYANAIDIETLTLTDGKVVSIAKHFDKTDGVPKKKEGLFLRTLSRRLYDENVFSSVLTPFFNRAHWNHFHIDISHFRNDGTRPQAD